MEKLTDEYIAGLFDGEGCISLAKTKSRATDTHYIYRPVVMIANSNLEVLTDIQTYLKYGRIEKMGKRKALYKQVYTLTIGSMYQMTYFLEAIRPKLRIKDEEADLLLEFLKRRLQYKGANYRHNPYSIEDEYVYQKLKVFKGLRGRSKRKTLKVTSEYKWQNES